MNRRGLSVAIVVTIASEVVVTIASKSLNTFRAFFIWKVGMCYIKKSLYYVALVLMLYKCYIACYIACAI